MIPDSHRLWAEEIRKKLSVKMPLSVCAARECDGMPYTVCDGK